jgi:hypothetical protein
MTNITSSIQRLNGGLGNLQPLEHMRQSNLVMNSKSPLHCSTAIQTTLSCASRMPCHESIATRQHLHEPKKIFVRTKAQKAETPCAPYHMAHKWVGVLKIPIFPESGWL